MSQERLSKNPEATQPTISDLRSRVFSVVREHALVDGNSNNRSVSLLARITPLTFRHLTYQCEVRCSRYPAEDLTPDQLARIIVELEIIHFGRYLRATGHSAKIIRTAFPPAEWEAEVADMSSYLLLTERLQGLPQAAFSTKSW